MNGLVSAASMDSGKIIDIAVMSKHCKCKNKKHGENCPANFSGTSGSMEVSGAEKIFARSVDQYGVRYVNYLGDGDSKAFMRVVQNKPYGDNIEIKKLECVGHIQKRMGTRLRNLKATKRKLSDGKSIM